MPDSYFTTVFDQSAAQVWAVIRDFNNYPVWVEGAGSSFIEEGKAGDQVGAIRNVHVDSSNIRQRLLALSDLDLSFTYEFCEPVPAHLRNYRATLKVRPISDSDSALVEWSATFDCALDDAAQWTTFYEQSFAKWLESLRRYLSGLNGAGDVRRGVQM